MKTNRVPLTSEQMIIDLLKQLKDRLEQGQTKDFKALDIITELDVRIKTAMSLLKGFIHKEK
tara:strand:+ start:3061 stop:3246 length:186 start_codon:yes stop_codon:yes gene_type:complete